jgi:transposase InsO family protein
VIGVIDVWSRRLMLQVHRSSSSHGISLLLRRALLTFGVPETVRTDNGAAYVSRHITEVLKRLGVAHDILPPFSPERKPFIERALKTFAYDLVEMLPGFVGHSVAEAQAIRARQTFAQRLFGRGETVELRMSAADFQAFCDDWTQAYHGRASGRASSRFAAR